MTFSVPPMLISLDVSGSCTDRGTEGIAPSWNAPAHGAADALVGAKIALDDLDLARDVGEVRAMTGREVVEDPDLVTLAQEAVGEG